MPAYEFTVKGNKLVYNISDKHTFTCELDTGEKVEADSFSALRDAVAQKVEAVKKERAELKPMPVLLEDNGWDRKDFEPAEVVGIHAANGNPIIRQGNRPSKQFTGGTLYVGMSPDDVTKLKQLRDEHKKAYGQLSAFQAKFSCRVRDIADRFNAFQKGGK